MRVTLGTFQAGSGRRPQYQGTAARVVGGAGSRVAARSILPRRVHVAGADRRHLAYHQQGGHLRHPVQGVGRDDADDRRRSQASRGQDRHHVGAAHLGFGDDAPSARAHDRARRRHIRSTATMDRRAGRVSSCRCGFCRGLFRRLVHRDAARRPRRWQVCILRRSCRARRLPQPFAAFLSPLRKIEWVVYAKSPFGGPEAGARLSVALHAPRRHLESSAGRRDDTASRSNTRTIASKGPARFKTMTLASRRVYPAVPAPRAAERLPPHPPLRAARQRQARESLAKARELLAVPAPFRAGPENTKTTSRHLPTPCPCCGAGCSSSRSLHAVARRAISRR